jgi:superfamily II DNA or RNA helicase
MGSAPTESVRNTFPNEMAFRRTWRTYQSRLLDKLDSYLENNRLHVVAAPGSGKTVFGLEVVRRINQRTLVLAPTITIRNQWVERLVEHFLPPDSPKPNWISTDIRHPQLFTVATYQALHALCSGEAEHVEEQTPEEQNGLGAEPTTGNGNEKPKVPVHLPDSLTGFKTLVVDEAHHLRAEWWRTLTFVSEQLRPTIVALTATPPYDVSPYEWQRYEELCGAVDAEVAVPELVLQGDLCPHQDYVYFSTPAEPEQKTLTEFRTSVDAFIARLRQNNKFTSAIAVHPWITNPDLHMEEILNDPEYLSSMVIFLNAAGDNVPSEVLDALGIGLKRIPPLDLEWLEVLLTHCLYSDVENFSAIESTTKTIRHELLAIGAIERRRVVLQNSSDHAKLLTTSVTKLHSIEEIVRLEAGAQGEKLRCVVLTDFIRKTELPKTTEELSTFEDIGVVPIFETLRRADIPVMHLGVLCGSLVIVPASCEVMIRKTASSLGIRLDDLTLRPLIHDPNYLSIEITGEYRQGSVRLLTAVFEQGGITVLVGTKSLLGEGWDAPTINTLILASFVGSYVLSNQMRGRSIRVDPACPTKTANIWHLVCAEPGLFGPGNDYELLVRRCSAFVGVNAASSIIENGTERLGLGKPPFTRAQIGDLNDRTCRRALDRDGLRRSWDEALAAGPMKQMTYGLKAKEEALPRGFIISSTLASLLVQAGSVAIFMLIGYLRLLPKLRSASEYLAYGIFVAAVIVLNCLPWTVLALWRFIRHGTPERSIKQIGSAVLESLSFAGVIDESAANFRIYANRNEDGTVYCWIAGGSGREQAIYLRALREVLSPVDNPRYLLARKKLWRFFGEDYFVVPDLLARKKAFAEFFAKRWGRRVGPVQLVYTRTPEGRKILLRARMHSLTAAFQKRTERVSCWK